MTIFKRYRNLWMAGVIIVIAILFIVNFSIVVDGIRAIWASITGLLYGAMLAFILNLIMEPVENRLLKCKKTYIQKHARPLALLTAFVVSILIIVLLMSIVIPNMINAIQVLTKEAPTYFNEVENIIKDLLHKYPALSQSEESLDINWPETIEKLLRFLTKGVAGSAAVSNPLDSTINVVTSVVNAGVNTFIIVVFAIYVLADKERFVRLYHTMTRLYLSPDRTAHLSRNLHILNQSFKAFVGGEIIEAAILSTMCIVGMWILRLPYATMIGILVGVINMIPMVGAFIGGGIGAFIIFTISPLKCLIFLIFLIVIQQIESNIFFPRIIGNRVGLPGIYVMMTIVIGGSLFGVFGMILGVPIVAAGYKIFNLYIKEKEARMEAKAKEKEIRKEKEEAQAAARKQALEQAENPAPVQKVLVEQETVDGKQLYTELFETPESYEDAACKVQDKTFYKLGDLMDKAEQALASKKNEADPKDGKLDK